MDDTTLNPPALRRAVATDAEALLAIDSVAAAGEPHRAASIRTWCHQGLATVAEDTTVAGDTGDRGAPLGYCVVENSFFGQPFIGMLMVAPHARGQGVGALLLDHAVATCRAPKIFTSINLSNHPMQRLLQRGGWWPMGMLHGLDEGDPELFYRRATETG